MPDDLKTIICRWLLDRADLALLVTDADGTVVLANAGAQSRFGYSAEQFAGLRLETLIADLPDGKRQPSLANHVATPSFESGRKISARRRDGSEFLVKLRTSPLEGGLTLAVFEDLAEHERIEQTLSEEELQYRAIIETAADGFWIVAGDGRILAINDTYARRSGYSRDELLSMRVSDLEAVESASDVSAHIEKVLANGSDQFETWHRTKSGEVWPVEIFVSYWANAGGRLFVFARDITARKLTQEALRESEARFRAIFEHAAVGIAQLAPDGRWLRMNDKLCEIVGYPREELQKRTFQSITHPDDLDADLDLARQLLAGEIDHYQMEKRYLRKGGGTVWVNLTATAVRHPDGTPDYAIAAVEDISERKRAEAALKDLQLEMEQLTRQQAAKQTVAAIAHELNQPLSAVAAYAEAALRLLHAGKPQPERLRHALESSAQQAQRAGSVVRELMAFLNKSEIATEPLDLNDLVRRALDQINMDGHAGIAIHFDLATGLAPVRANRLQVEKVLVNIIKNGIEAMHDAGTGMRSISLTVRTSVEGSMARAAVCDSGAGIATDTLHRIFEPFFTTKSDGLGMGLAISRAIIESHGGQLWAESVQGAGACFNFTLPFAP